MLGGAFADNATTTWTWCFLLNLFLAFGGFIALICLLPPIKHCIHPSRGHPTRAMWYFDLASTLMSFLSTICLLLAINLGGVTLAWSDARVITCLVISATLLLAVLAVLFWGNSVAMIPRSAALQRQVAASAIYGFLMSAAFFALVYFLPLWFQGVQGMSAVQSGTNNLSLTVSHAAGSVIAGVLVGLIGYSVPLMFAGTIMASIGSGFLTSLSPLTPDPQPSQSIGYQVIAGLALGLTPNRSSPRRHRSRLTTFPRLPRLSPTCHYLAVRYSHPSPRTSLLVPYWTGSQRAISLRWIETPWHMRERRSWGVWSVRRRYPCLWGRIRMEW